MPTRLLLKKRPIELTMLSLPPVPAIIPLFSSLGNEGMCKELSEAMEDYCLSKAMDEAEGTPLLSREEALAYLEA